MADTTSQTDLSNLGPFECPICLCPMNISMSNYPDEPPMPTVDCSECGLEALVSNFEDEKTHQRIVNYQLRLLLGQIAQGEKAKDIINNHPVYPFSASRSDVLVGLMASEVSQPVEHPDNKPLPALSSEEIELVKNALNL